MLGAKAMMACAMALVLGAAPLSNAHAAEIGKHKAKAHKHHKHEKKKHHHHHKKT